MMNPRHIAGNAEEEGDPRDIAGKAAEEEEW